MKKALPFQFKQFTVQHDRCAMKVGTDAVLLGAWVNVRKAERILDLGTGSGVIALMLAQRTKGNVQIDAIEIEPREAAQAKENVSNSPWPNKVLVVETSVQKYNPGIRFDLIVSNPPFFVKSLLPPSAGRIRTRHAEQLTFDELVYNSIRLLSTAGVLGVILPLSEGNEFKKIASRRGLHLRRRLAFYSRKEKPQERWLFEFGLESSALQEETLILYDKDNRKSRDYVSLTRDFYL